MRYCKLGKTTIKDMMHNMKHRGKCPYSFRCILKKHEKPKCKYLSSL